MTEEEVQVLYRNSQWMVQREPRGEFLVEINEQYPDDLEGDYWIRAKDLEHKSDCHNMIQHVCGKTWCDLEAFEEAVGWAMILLGLKMDYDVAAEFREARRIRSIHRRREPRKPGLYRPSELRGEVIELFSDGEATE